MKQKNLSLFGRLLLGGAIFAVIGCTDYAEDIRQVNDRIDNEVIVSVENLEKSISELQSKLASDYALKTEVASLKSELESSIAAEVSKLNQSITELSNGIKDNASAISALKVAQEATDKAIESLKGSIANLESSKADKTEVEALKNTVSGIADKLETLSSELSALAGRVSKNEADIASLQSDVLNLKEETTAIRAAIDGLDARLTVLEGKVDENTEKIAELIEEMESVKNAVAKNAEDIKANAAAIADLVEADLVINGRIDDLSSQLESHIADFNAQVAIYNEEIAGIKEHNAEQDALIESLTARADKMESSIASLEADLSELTQRVDEIRNDLDELKASAATKDELKAAQENLQKQINSLKGLIEGIETRLGAVETSVKDLLDRIQSIVYIPEYSDGKATVSYATMGDVPVTSYFTMAYQVKPDKEASTIAGKAEALSFLFKEVKTRSAENAGLEIVNAKGDADGVLTLTVKAENFADGFFSSPASPSYSAALLLSDGNNDYTTEYTNLIAGTPEVITMSVYDSEGRDINGIENAAEYKVQYTDTTSREILKRHYLGFTIGEKPEIRTIAEMKELGYFFNVEQEVTYEYNDETYKDIFNNAEGNGDLEVEKFVEVSLKEANPAAVGTIETVKYAYSSNGLSAATAATIEITKIQTMVNLAPITVEWKYSTDAQSDADLFVENTNITTARNDMPADIVKSTLPEDTEIKDFIGTVEPKTTFMINDTEVKGPEAVFSLDEENNILISFSKFAWGKTYKIKSTYTLDSKDIIVEIEISTVDRNRETIKVVFDEKTEGNTFTLARDLEIKAEADNLAEIPESRTADIDIDSEEYLTDIFVEHETSNVMNFIGEREGKESWITGYHINADGQTGYAEYTYRTFRDIVSNPLVYTKTFTTWYGQEVEIQKYVYFEYPEFDFQYVKYWVYSPGLAPKYYKGYYSIPQAKYSPEGNNPMEIAVEKYEVSAIDMNEAFTVIDINGGAPVDLEKEGLKVEFDFRETPVSPAITFSENKINYGGDDEHVAVSGRLLITNSDGTPAAVIPTSFDNNGIYSTYIVYRPEPIQPVLTKTDTVKVYLDNAVKYTTNLLENIIVKDERGFEIVSDGEWITGDGLNGYADGVIAKDVYGLEAMFNDVITEISKVNYSFAKYISLEENMLTMNNETNLALTEAVTVPVTFNISHNWNKTNSVTYYLKFTNSKIENN